MHVWTVSNQKGGVGKTTTTITIGGLLSQSGKRVLLIDLDPQSSLASYFRCEVEDIAKSSFELFDNPEKLNTDFVKGLIHKTKYNNLNVLPGSLALSTLDRKASNRKGMGFVIKKAIACLGEDYDHVVIDCPPSTGVLMINALAACNLLIIPVQTEFLALKGLEKIMHTLTMMNKSRSFDMDFIILPTMHDKRTRACQTVLRQIRHMYDDFVWHSAIPADTKIREASQYGMPASIFCPDSNAVWYYDLFTKNLLEKMSKEESITNLRAKEI